MFNIQAQGFPLKSYLPKNNTKEELIRWTFDCVERYNQDYSAVAEQKAAMKKAANMYPAADFDFGAASWNWPDMAICSQQLIRYTLFDPKYGYFARGAHMPLMVFIGEKGKTRRSGGGRARRSEKAAARGWPRSRIEAAKKAQTDPNRGSGESFWFGNVQPPQWKEFARNNSLPCQPTSRADGPSSSSSQSPKDPSRTAWQDKWGWKSGWSSNDYNDWKH